MLQRGIKVDNDIEFGNSHMRALVALEGSIPE